MLCYSPYHHNDQSSPTAYLILDYIMRCYLKKRILTELIFKSYSNFHIRDETGRDEGKFLSGRILQPNGFSRTFLATAPMTLWKCRVIYTVPDETDSFSNSVSHSLNRWLRESTEFTRRHPSSPVPTVTVSIFISASP